MTPPLCSHASPSRHLALLSCATSRVHPCPPTLFALAGCRVASCHLLLPPPPPQPLCLFASGSADDSTVVRIPNDDRKWSSSFLLALAIETSLSLLSLVLCSFDNDGSLPLLLRDGVDVSGHLHGWITPSSDDVVVVIFLACSGNQDILVVIVIIAVVIIVVVPLLCQ